MEMMKRLIPVFLLLFLSSPVYADDYQDGVDAYHRKDYKTAFEKFKPLAEQGHEKAQLYLRVMHGKGKGVYPQPSPSPRYLPHQIPKKVAPPATRKFAWPSWFGKKPPMPTMIETKELSPMELYKRVNQSVYVVIASPTLTDLRLYKNSFQGSAVAISPSMALTNCHILKNANLILLLREKQKFSSKIQFADMENDKCIIKIEKNSLIPISGVRSYSELQVGEEVFTIGSPSGLENTLGKGLISRLHQGKNINFIQTSAPISPGSSGGGLFDNRGNLIGITTLYLENTQNLNFAIAVDEFWK